MALHGQDMEFTAQRNGITTVKSIKPWLKDMQSRLAIQLQLT
jgi:hypothetical protein